MNYTRVTYDEPHAGRTRQILKAHPEVKALYGVWIALVVASQFVAAFLLKDTPWWAVLAGAWLFGAFADHALFVLIHECAHNLAARKPASNKLLAILANLPGVVPSAIAFRHYHLLHHKYQGELGWDADLAGPKEAAWVGDSTVRKIIWFTFFSLIEGLVRPLRVRRVFLLDRWGALNLAATVGAAGAVFYFWGFGAFAYLLLSTFFSVGLHPVGGRWIQEHYIVKPNQETYSYYGPANAIAFNVGFHNEHHDFMSIPWPNLPKLKALAPEFYDPLHAHRSWSGLLLRFLFDRKLTLFSRVVRPDHDQAVEAPVEKAA